MEIGFLCFKIYIINNNLYWSQGIIDYKARFCAIHRGSLGFRRRVAVADQPCLIQLVQNAIDSGPVRVFASNPLPSPGSLAIITDERPQYLLPVAAGIRWTQLQRKERH
jgi:hypothetical protein